MNLQKNLGKKFEPEHKKKDIKRNQKAQNKRQEEARRSQKKPKEAKRGQYKIKKAKTVYKKLKRRKFQNIEFNVLIISMQYVILPKSILFWAISLHHICICFYLLLETHIAEEAKKGFKKG